jgi:hypothetical protein
MRRFISGPFAGTKLEIMPSKAATNLPDGTPINTKPITQDVSLGSKWFDSLNNTQRAYLTVGSGVDIHAPQVFVLLDDNAKECFKYEGPSIAQEWKILHRGERPFYHNKGIA